MEATNWKNLLEKDSYKGNFRVKNGTLSPENTYFWDFYL
jgi:hypothetical protein